jgi:hypothetical protein
MEHELYDHTAVKQSLDVGGGVTLLLTDTDERNPHGVRVRHVCSRWPDAQEPDGEFVKVIAPALAPGHVVHSLDPVTITASILCPDCGLHGFVTHGAWQSA